jgi:DNA-binding transcriptional ArsR family regulator
MSRIENHGELEHEAIWKNKKALEPGWVPYGFRSPVAGGDRIHAVIGPRGSGTSTVANRLVHELTVRSHARFFQADMCNGEGDHGIMVQLYRNLDSTFDGQGFSGLRLAVLFQRRLAAMEQPAVVWFDNVRKGSDNSTLWSLFLDSSALSPNASVVISGETDPTVCLGTGVDRVVLSSPGPREIRNVAEALCREAFRALPEQEVLQNLTDTMSCNGRSLSRTAAILKVAGERAEARGASRVELVDLSPLPRELGRRQNPEEVDRAIVEAVRKLGKEKSVPAGDLVRYIGRNDSLVRRHLRSLEEKGVIVRKVIIGGSGGTRSTVSLSANLAPRQGVL